MLPTTTGLVEFGDGRLAQPANRIQAFLGGGGEFDAAMPLAHGAFLGVEFVHKL